MGIAFSWEEQQMLVTDEDDNKRWADITESLESVLQILNFLSVLRVTNCLDSYTSAIAFPTQILWYSESATLCFSNDDEFLSKSCSLTLRPKSVSEEFRQTPAGRQMNDPTQGSGLTALSFLFVTEEVPTSCIPPP
ncbi:hypothetical protein Nepgr_008593 [Nepenthes gracilis]|uniref:Uncharacterized protein n=1 Tax=Nepenthes gracilis TaxID=150966 RepID=A0AAD3S8Z8_NEPGR|nr:hypothetical protein Nepgr_008593 [Nepenthes gracilis]